MSPGLLSLVRERAKADPPAAAKDDKGLWVTKDSQDERAERFERS